MTHYLRNGLAAMILGATGAVAVANDPEPVLEPIPEPIEKADVRIDLEPVAEGLVSPIWGTHAGDGSGRFFVVDQVGHVRLIRNGELEEQPYLDVTDYIVDLQEGFDERGLLGLAFHPDFADEGADGYGLMYAHTSEPLEDHNPADFSTYMPDDLPANHVGVISEFRAADHTADHVDPSQRRVLMTFEQPQFNHNGGVIAFGPDNMLYISLGDGGAANDIGPGHTPDIGNAQDTTNILGNILRIDPLGQNGEASARGEYTVPDDNPFVDDADILDEIWAYGLRNAFLMSFDREQGTLVAADVGQEHLEIINIVEGGENFGWNYMEGTFYFNPDAPAGNNVFAEPLPDRPIPGHLEFTDPVAQYDHAEGSCIMGGFVYRGDAVPALQGRYVFGDWERHEVPGSDQTQGRLFVCDIYGDGVIYALPVADGDSHTGDYVTGFGEDEDGEIYLLTNDTSGPRGYNGKVQRIVPYNP